MAVSNLSLDVAAPRNAHVGIQLKEADFCLERHGGR